MSASFFAHPLAPSLTQWRREIRHLPVSRRRYGTRSAQMEMA